MKRITTLMAVGALALPLSLSTFAAGQTAPATAKMAAGTAASTMAPAAAGKQATTGKGHRKHHKRDKQAKGATTPAPSPAK